MWGLIPLCLSKGLLNSCLAFQSKKSIQVDIDIKKMLKTASKSNEMECKQTNIY